ncbi:MAG: DUF1735 domain-containing protein, partial [Odoribacter sp.]|nr:DUF1735 domain-containing protein [Odoribacter sp.]
MKKIKTIFLALCGMGLLLTGCEDNRKEYQEDYQTLLYFRNGGDQTLKLYRVGENTVYEIPVCKGGLDRKATGVAMISVMEQSQLDMYNLENETRYRQLPDTCFRFLSETELSFASDEDSKTVRVEIETDKVSSVQESDTENEYVLALQVRADKTVSPDINLLILHLGIDIPYVSLGTSGVLSYSYTSASPNENPYTNSVVLGLDNRWDFTCELAVRDQEWLDAYNAENGTDYQLLPAENYTVPENVSFTAGSNNAAFEVSVNRQGMSLLQEFVVPVYIASCSKPQFVVDEEASTVLLNVRLDPDKIPLTEEMLSSPFTQNGDGKGLSTLVDDEVATVYADQGYWHSNWGSAVGDEVYGHYIDIALNSPLSAVVLGYNVRGDNGNGAP